MNNIPGAISTLIAGVLITLTSLWYGQNNGLMPVAASAEAPLVDGVFNAMMTIATGLFLLIQGTLIIAIFKFRQRKGDMADGPPIYGNIPLEILWTAIPAVIALGIAVYSFNVYEAMGGLDPAMNHDSPIKQAASGPRIALGGAALAAPLESEIDTETTATNLPTSDLLAVGIGAPPETQGQVPDLVVNVTGLQYAWIINYPDSGVISGELHLPAGREVQLNIVAQDVIHAFWVPQFRLKQDAIPGRETQLRFIPEQVGEYPLICAELCGAYHAAMKTRVIVEETEAFDTWIQQQVASRDDFTQEIAMKSPGQPETEFLASYANELGVTAKTLKQLRSLNHNGERPMASPRV